MRVLIACEFSGVVRRAFRALGHDAWSCDLLESEDDSPYHIQADALEVARRGLCVREITTPSNEWCCGAGKNDPGHPAVDYHKIYESWDMMIAHPPCTYLNGAAEWLLKDADFARYPGVGYHQRTKPGTLTGLARRKARDEAVAFVEALWDAPIERVAIENPVGCLPSRFRPWSQLIHPHQFGADASKGTCLWLKNLDPLVPTLHIPPRLVEYPKGSGKIVKRWANQTDSGQNRLTPSEDRWAKRSETYPGIGDAMALQWGGRL